MLRGVSAGKVFQTDPFARDIVVETGADDEIGKPLVSAERRTARRTDQETRVFERARFTNRARKRHGSGWRLG